MHEFELVKFNIISPSRIGTPHGKATEGKKEKKEKTTFMSQVTEPYMLKYR